MWLLFFYGRSILLYHKYYLKILQNFYKGSFKSTFVLKTMHEHRFWPLLVWPLLLPLRKHTFWMALNRFTAIVFLELRCKLFSLCWEYRNPRKYFDILEFLNNVCNLLFDILSYTSWNFGSFAHYFRAPRNLTHFEL